MPLLRHPIRIRWWIFAYLFGFALISYVQRTSVAVAADKLMPVLHLTQLQIGWLNAAFTTAYAIAQLPGGILGQRFGARATYIAVGLVGLTATLATPLAPVVLAGTGLFLALLAAQALLGFSQGPVFPMSAAVIQAWFPANRWAMVNGLQTAGMNVGGAITPLLFVVLTEAFGWQRALLCVAVPAALLTAGWAWYGRNSPREHRSVSAAELGELGAAEDQQIAPLTMRRMRGDPRRSQRAAAVGLLSVHELRLLFAQLLVLSVSDPGPALQWP